MARMRTIKPGYFTNEDLADATIPARLLGAALPCQADREGRLEDKPKKIKLESLPWDNVDVDALLHELATLPDPFILRYQVEGKRYIQILKFNKHQRPHHREPDSVIPPPPGYMPHPEDDGPDEGEAKPGARPDQSAARPHGIGDRGSEIQVLGSGEGDPASRAGAPEGSPTTLDSLRSSPRELAPQRRVLEDVSRDGEAGTVGEDELGAGETLVEANGWMFAPDDVAALMRAAENVTTPPLELPITVRGRLMKRVQLAAGDPQRFDQAVLDVWDAMPGDQLARWVEAGMILALIKKGKEDRGGLLAFAAGIIGQALTVKEDLPTTAARRSGIGVATPSAPAPAANDWRAWLPKQGGQGHEAFTLAVVKSFERELPGAAGRYAPLFWAVRDKAIADAGNDDPPTRDMAQQLARDFCLQELWGELGQAKAAAAGGGR